MHAHLADCIKDYGPLSSFLLFSFERYNGLLGDISTNNQSIELQVMNRFIHDNCYMQGLSYSPTESSQINTLLKSAVVDHTLGVVSLKYKAKSTAQSTHACTSGFSYIPAHKYTLAAFTPSQVQALSSDYFSLYGSLVDLNIPVANIPRTYKRMRSVTINGQ